MHVTADALTCKLLLHVLYAILQPLSVGVVQRLCVSQVLAEAERVFGPSGHNTASRSDADGMAYTLSVLKEALRR